jgi:hypothetical protein
MFFKRGLHQLCFSSVTPNHLAGHGGEEVVREEAWMARASAGSLWELQEFRLSMAVLPRGDVKLPRLEVTRVTMPSSMHRIARDFSSS